MVSRPDQWTSYWHNSFAEWYSSTQKVSSKRHDGRWVGRMARLDHDVMLNLQIVIQINRENQSCNNVV